MVIVAQTQGFAMYRVIKIPKPSNPLHPLPTYKVDSRSSGVIGGQTRSKGLPADPSSAAGQCFSLLYVSPQREPHKRDKLVPHCLAYIRQVRDKDDPARTIILLFFVTYVLRRVLFVVTLISAHTLPPVLGEMHGASDIYTSLWIICLAHYIRQRTCTHTHTQTHRHTDTHTHVHAHS